MDKQKQYRQHKPVGRCPVCGKGTVVEMSKGWSCDKWRDPVNTCKFTIWKTMCEVEISETVARELVKNGVSPEKIEGLVSKRTGKTFSAWLVVDPDEARVVFDFGKEKPQPRQKQSNTSPARSSSSPVPPPPGDNDDDDPFAEIIL